MGKSYFDYKAYEKWANSLGIASKQFKDWLYQFLLQQGERVKSLAITRQNTYTYTTAQGKQKIGLIDTGNMIRSWYVGDIEVEGNSIYVTIGNPVEYASYIEYGQRSFSGAYLLTVSIDEVQKQLPARFNKEWLSWLASKGVV